MPDLKGKTAIVTGAARGIGQATARRLASAGANVVVTDVLEDELKAVADSITADGSKAIARRLDVSKKEEWDKLFSDVQSEFGSVDIMINNAGIALLGNIEDVKAEDWQRIHDVNIMGVFFGTQGAITAMKEKGGAIVNLSSIAGDVAELNFAAYNASKGAVKMLTKNAAVHCAKAGYPVRINSIHPGYTETPLIAGALGAIPPEMAQALVQETVGRIPMGRFAQPDEIAGPILFLVSDDASYVTGSALTVDGGYTAM